MSVIVTDFVGEDLERRHQQPIVDHQPRCWRCKRIVLYYAARPWRVLCKSCRSINSSPPPPNP